MFSNAPKGLVGITTIRPVNEVLRASIAERAVSVSPTIAKVLGSIASLFRNFLFANAGTFSGIITYTYSDLL